NQFAGELSARALLRTATIFPSEIRYTQDNSNRTDPVYRAVGGTLAFAVDSATVAGGGELQLFRIAQAWERNSVSWINAVDTGGVRTPWTQPGGTRGELVSVGTYTPQLAGDSVFFELDSADMQVLRDSTGNGVLIASSVPGARIQLARNFQLRARLRPTTPVRDTVIETRLDFPAANQTFIFNPEPPRPAGALVAGGLRSARTLLDFTLPDSVEGCAVAQRPCPRVALRNVRLNRVSILLRRLPVPPAFAPRDSALLTLRSVTEPELGRRAPLGGLILDANPLVFSLGTSGLTAQQAAVFAPTDSVVELPLTNYAIARLASDSTRTVPNYLALLGGPIDALPGTRLYDTFGVTAFDAEPRLRIVYTLPVRTQLP
ncbi:MAG TPA: hypothetical protein VF625_04740, partial [Longimicrobium sp.]